MFFTKDDYKKIAEYLRKIGVKDTDFEVTEELKDKDSIPIIQDGVNKIIPADVFTAGLTTDITQETGQSAAKVMSQKAVTDELGKKPSNEDLNNFKDAINTSIREQNNKIESNTNNIESAQTQIDALVSRSDVVDVVANKAALDSYDKSSITENDVIKVLKDESRDNAITYYRLVSNNWVFIGSLGEIYTKTEVDEKIKALPNNEDINFDENNRLQFSDRPNTNSMGYKILRKNKVFAQQVTEPNTIYEIRYDFDLKDDTVTIPPNCVLKFEGGSLSRGTVVGDRTQIDANSGSWIFKDSLVIDGLFNIEKSYPEWFGENVNTIHKAYKLNRNVYLQDNIYKVSQGLKLESKSSIIGNGKSIIKTFSDITGGILYSDGLKDLSECTLSGFTLYNDYNTFNSDFGIKLHFPTNETKLQHLKIEGFKDTGLYLTKCWYASFFDITILHCLVGLRLSKEIGRVNGLTFYNIFIRHSLSGVDAHALLIDKIAGYSLCFIGCDFEACAKQDGILVDGVESNVTFVNCHSENCPMTVKSAWNRIGVLNIVGCFSSLGEKFYHIITTKLHTFNCIGSYIYNTKVQNLPNKDIKSEASFNYLYNITSESTSNGLIEATGYVFGDQGKCPSDDDYKNNASSFSSKEIVANSNSKFGNLGIGRRWGKDSKRDEAYRFFLRCLNNQKLSLVRGILTNDSAVELKEELLGIVSKEGYELTNREDRGYGKYPKQKFIVKNYLPSYGDNGRMIGVKCGVDLVKFDTPSSEWKFGDGTGGGFSLQYVVNSIINDGGAEKEIPFLSVDQDGYIKTYTQKAKHSKMCIRCTRGKFEEKPTDAKYGDMHFVTDRQLEGSKVYGFYIVYTGKEWTDLIGRPVV